MGSDAFGTGVPSVAAGSLAVELLPEGTGRLGSRTSIGPRLAVVVDRTAGMRTVHTTLQQVSGFAVECFDTLDDVARRSGGPPDVVVMEPRSQGTDPLRVLRRWHDLASPSAPPVVWCTTMTPTQHHLDNGARLGLRGVVIKPFRVEALMALVVRVVRTHERESRLRTLGVDVQRIAGPLPPDATRQWLRVESQLAAAHVRPLSLVCVDSAAPAVQGAVRTVIRNVDRVAQLDAGTLAVLLPDVDSAGAAVVAQRVRGAVPGVAGGQAVWPVTRADGESADALLARALNPA